MKVKVRYKAKATNLIERILDSLRSKPNRIIKETARIILRESQLLCPMRTGALRLSGQMVKSGPNEYTVSYGNEEVNYDIYVEYGTRYMRAQPFFNPAVEIARKYFNDEMSKVFKPV